MTFFEIILGELLIQLDDLDSQINPEFLNLYESFFSKKAINFTNFKKQSMLFFDRNNDRWDKHNGFFNNFTVIWRAYMNQMNYKLADNLWNIAFQIVSEWEKKNSTKRIHKGSLFYFWGINSILNNDLEKGFLLIHQSLEEDRKTHNTNNPDTPSFAFTTLNFEKQDQLFKWRISELAGFLEEKITNYCSQRGGNLTLKVFKTKFLELTPLIDSVFYFVYNLLLLKKLLIEIDNRLEQNEFSSLIQTKIFFSLCLILDNFLKLKDPNSSHWQFIDLLDFLSGRTSLNINRSKLGEINTEFRNNFPNTLNSILKSTFRCNDGSSLSLIEEDIAISYGFRNFGAHKIKNDIFIYSNFEEISTRILNSLFFSIEKL